MRRPPLSLVQTQYRGALNGEWKDKNAMKCEFVVVCVLLATLMSGCTSNPYAPLNQMTPVRQMDNAFEGRPINAPPPGYQSQRDRDYDAYGPPPYPRY
jgi:hypothetical protein